MLLPKAFSLIELLLVMALLAIIGTSISLSVVSSTSKNILNSQAQKLANLLRTARISSRESKPVGLAPAKWGVAITSNSYKLVTIPVSAQITYPADNGITLSPATTIMFDNITGDPNPPSAITITLSHLTNQKNISISAIGLIEIN